MALIVILICLSVQRIFLFEIPKLNFNWFITYYSRLDRVFADTSWWRSYGGLALLIISVAIAYIALVAIFTYFMGMVFTFLLQLTILWYYLEARPLKELSANSVSIADVFANRYHNIFALIFWFLILGPFGVILYAELRNLENHLKIESKADVYFSGDFLQKITFIRGLFDWIPIRLLGLTYALVGHFKPAFQYWCNYLSGVQLESPLVVNYGLMALNWDPNVVSGTQVEMNEIESLTNRALIVWLVAIALFTIGKYI